MPLRLRDLALPVQPIRGSVTASAALAVVLSDPALFAVPVDLGRPDPGLPGLLSRGRLTEALAGPNGRDVFASRPVAHLAVAMPTVMDADTPAALAALELSQAGSADIIDGIMVTDQGAYFGLVSPAALLKAVAEENAGRARALGAAKATLQSARTRMVRLTNNRAQLLAFLGHEIRTPLTGILGVADLLHDQTSNSETRKLARTIVESGQHLERLLSDLLDLSRIEAGKLTVVPAVFDLRRFAAETRDLWTPRFAEKRVDLQITVEPRAEARIESDAARLRQILFNLVSNAVKFTDRGQVSVVLSTAQAVSGLSLVMSVADTGRGISDADKQRLFAAFEQADGDLAAARSGTGLGLAIARALARRLGGDIDLRDNPGGGTIFTVTVPVQRAGPRLAVKNTAASRPASFDLGEILVAEDHDTTALVIREALIAAGWQVETVGDAPAAIARASVRRYQAILSDIHMPGGGADAVLRAVRTGQGPNRHVPVIAITADISPERRALCDQLGYSGLIEKPVRPRRLVAALADALLGTAQQRRAASA